MPTYGYVCKSCGHRFEQFQRISDPPLCQCPQCGGEIQRLIFGGTGIIFKGSGWYVTDYGKGKSSATIGSKHECAAENTLDKPTQKDDSIKAKNNSTEER